MYYIIVSMTFFPFVHSYCYKANTANLYVTIYSIIIYMAYWITQPKPKTWLFHRLLGLYLKVTFIQHFSRPLDGSVRVSQSSMHNMMSQSKSTAWHISLYLQDIIFRGVLHTTYKTVVPVTNKNNNVIYSRYHKMNTV